MLTSRREFCKTFAAIGACAATGLTLRGAAAIVINPHHEDRIMPFTLPELPYAQNALEPHISANTLSFHHGKHHKAYVDKLNELVAGTPLENASLEDVIKQTAKDEAKETVFNNAAQVWNLTFYWNCMKPNGGGKPTGKIAELIERDLGGYDKFKEDFKQGRHHAVRQRLGMAGAGRRQAQHHENAERRPAHGAWQKSRADHGRVGGMLTIWTTRTAGPITRRHSSKSSSTGTS